MKSAVHCTHNNNNDNCHNNHNFGCAAVSSQRIPTCDCSISYLKEVLPSVLMRVYIFLVLLHSQILTISVKSGVHHSR